MYKTQMSEEAYLNILRRCLNAPIKPNRTGISAHSIFAQSLRFNLEEGGQRIIPLLSTKKVFWRSIFYELLWFMRGETDLEYLHKHNVHIWDANADGGPLGPIYGKQWRNITRHDGTTVDQLAQVIHDIKTDPSSRRLLVSAWNVAELDKMALPPCFVGHTQIATQSGPKRIDEIKVGEMVITKEGIYEPVNEVHVTLYKGQIRCIKVAQDSETRSILATPNHPFWVFKGGHSWANASDIVVGDRLCQMTGDQIVCIGNTEEYYEGFVYNLDVGTSHTYVAEGLITHNCHYSFQFHVGYHASLDGDAIPHTLNCIVNMRSADIALGVPFNIASYAMLTHFVSHLTGLRPGELVLHMTDCHLYVNHVDGIKEQLTRVPSGTFPSVQFSNRLEHMTTLEELLTLEVADCKIVGYAPQPAISLPMAV